MKRFLKYVLMFSAIVIATLVVGEITVRHRPNPYSTKDHYIREHGKDIETLILGSSHTFFGIVADSVGCETMNLANISQNYEYDWRVLKRYYRYMPNLSRVIIPISYFSFFDPPFEESDNERWYEIYYKLYNGIDKYSTISKYNLEISNFHVFQGKLSGLISGKRHGLCSPQGFGLDYSHDTVDPEWQKHSEEHAGWHTAPDDRHTSYNIAYLDSLLSFCFTNNITPILISTPTWKDYRSHLDCRQAPRTRKITDSIATRHNLKYFDYSDDSRFNEDDFYDADHLCDKGANKFTRLLIRDSIFAE